MYNHLTQTHPAEEQTMSVLNNQVVRDIVSAAVSNIDACFPWKTIAGAEEPEERVEIYCLISGALDELADKIFEFDHAFPTSAQLADRIAKELSGQRVVHDLTRDLVEIKRTLIMDVADELLGHNTCLVRWNVVLVLEPIIKKVYIALALGIATGKIQKDYTNL